MFQATIEKTFSAAHALRLPDGTLEPLHGHDWRVAVTVASEGLDAMDTVMDFHALEKVVEQRIGPWRNQNLNAVSPFAAADAADEAGDSADENSANASGGAGLAINPSAERVAEQIAWAVSGALPDRVWLHDVAVGEAPGCVARYRP